MPSFLFEHQHPGLVAGIDEAGCGPWAGPVVAAAFVFKTYDVPLEILGLFEDSKKLSKKMRDRAYQVITQSNDTMAYGIGQVSVEEIDHLNIRNAAKLAMVRAFENLQETSKGLKVNYGLIDGIAAPEFGPRHQLGFTMIKKGDSLSYSIAAASIIAKVTRDRIMADLHHKHPQYGWERNAGYGTKVHMEALGVHGVTPHHRRSFAPIKKLIALRQAS